MYVHLYMHTTNHVFMKYFKWCVSNILKLCMLVYQSDCVILCVAMYVAHVPFMLHAQKLTLYSADIYFVLFTSQQFSIRESTFAYVH